MIPEYRVWAGVSIYIGATLIDFVLTVSESYPTDKLVGLVSLSGLCVALAWSQTA